MNYYGPRQVDPTANRTDAGKWRYTCQHDEQIWAVGYCRDCPGHDTPEEAQEHQRQYELDHAKFVRSDESLSAPGTNEECAVCGAACRSYALVGPGMPTPVYLCAKHLHREGLDEVLVVGEVISSS